MALGGVGFTVPFAACGHWRAGPSATIIIVMNESLRQHLECLARDERYRVDAVLKEGRLECMGFPNRCAMWLPRRRRSTLPIGSGRWERCARRSCTRSGAPSIFEGDILLLVRVVCGALAIFGVAIRLPKQVVRKIPDSSLVSEWMALYGPAALGMPLIPISPASRLVRQSRLCRLQCLVHQRCVMPKSGEDPRLLRMAQKSPFDGCGSFGPASRTACLWALAWRGISCWPPGARSWPSRALPPA